MRLPARITPQHPLRKLTAAIAIALVSTLVAVGVHRAPGSSVAMSGVDNTLYDAFYHFRKSEDRSNGPIVIVTVDESSLEEMSHVDYIWPWPRNTWQEIVKYMGNAGAKALVFDILFKDPRNFDIEFGAALDHAKIPVILATAAKPDGRPDKFSPKVRRPMMFGATNMLEDKIARRYSPDVHGLPTLAMRTAEAIGANRTSWPNYPFLLHYFGPTQKPDGNTTYRYVPASRVCRAAMVENGGAKVNIFPEMFRDKIVLIGGTATGTFDLKSSPLSPIYPGVEIHATAIDDLLTGQFVQPLTPFQTAGAAMLASLLAALGVLYPRKTTVKLLLALTATGVLVGAAVLMFTAPHIRWLAMASPIMAIVIATVGAFAWSYLTEDRQRKLVLKALSQYISPQVAAEIERNPASLKLGGERREMTVMFSDIQGFTDLSESMDSEKLSALLNYYLGEMSDLVLANDGTLDKYIGDAIMTFWNAPIYQPNHAAMACRAALAMRDREANIQDELAKRGADGMLTRIGINTGPMVFGNMGSPKKFNYSVLGDSVNLGSRLEGANKFYGSRILISETSAKLVAGGFVLRQLDVLRVKGKLQPLAVYELLAEGAPQPDLQIRVARYEEAWGFYRAQKWDEAHAILADLHARFADDHPAAALMRRVEKLRHDPPPADWDGVYVAKDK